MFFGRGLPDRLDFTGLAEAALTGRFLEPFWPGRDPWPPTEPDLAVRFRVELPSAEPDPVAPPEPVAERRRPGFPAEPDRLEDRFEDGRLSADALSLRFAPFDRVVFLAGRPDRVEPAVVRFGVVRFSPSAPRSDRVSSDRRLERVLEEPALEAPDLGEPDLDVLGFEDRDLGAEPFRDGEPLVGSEPFFEPEVFFGLDFELALELGFVLDLDFDLEPRLSRSSMGSGRDDRGWRAGVPSVSASRPSLRRIF